MVALETLAAEREYSIRVNGSKCRVWEKGTGDPLVLLSGLGGVPRWMEFHDRLAEQRRVLVVSLPGQHGSERGHEKLHNPIDWIAMTLDLIDCLDVAQPVDIVATSAAAMLAGELAALCRSVVRRLVLIGPFGLYDPAKPPRNIFAEAPRDRSRLLCAIPEAYATNYGPPMGNRDDDDFAATSYRADEATARLVWPFGDIKLRRRLHRIVAPTLLIWGSDDKIVPPTYAQSFIDGIAGRSRTVVVDRAGHLVAADAPEAVAEQVLHFLAESDGQ